MTFALQECLSMAKESFKSTGHPLIVVGTTSDPEKIPVGVMGAFKQEVIVEVRDCCVFGSRSRWHVVDNGTSVIGGIKGARRARATRDTQKDFAE
jgi:hypothetical protein